MDGSSEGGAVVSVVQGENVSWSGLFFCLWLVAVSRRMRYGNFTVYFAHVVGVPSVKSITLHKGCF